MRAIGIQPRRFRIAAAEQLAREIPPAMLVRRVCDELPVEVQDIDGVLGRPEDRTGHDGGPMGCNVNRNELTTPKLPPPPRSPQKRSGFSSALAVSTRPSAVTTSAERRLSQARP